MQIILLGGGGHCSSVLEGAKKTAASFRGYLAPSESINNVVSKLTWLGDEDNWFKKDEAPDYSYLVAVGHVKSPDARIRLFTKLLENKLHIANIIAANAKLPENISIGRGTVILQRVLINTNVKIGDNCIVNSAVVIEHDVVLSSHCHIAPGAIINGGVIIGNNCLIGSGAIIKEGTTVHSDVIVGAGAVVVKDITEPGLWYGNPARKIK